MTNDNVFTEAKSLINKIEQIMKKKTFQDLRNFYHIEVNDELKPILLNFEEKIINSICKKLNNLKIKGFSFYTYKYEDMYSLEIEYNNHKFGKIDLKTGEVIIYHSVKNKIKDFNYLEQMRMNSIFHLEDDIELSERIINKYSSNIFYKILFRNKIKLNEILIKDKQVIKERMIKAKESLKKSKRDIEIYKKDTERLIKELKKYGFYNNQQSEIHIRHFRYFLNEKSIYYRTQLPKYNYQSFFSLSMGEIVAIPEEHILDKDSIKHIAVKITTDTDFRQILKNNLNNNDFRLIYIDANEQFNENTNEMTIKDIEKKVLYDFNISRNLEDSIIYNIYINEIMFQYKGVLYSLDNKGQVITTEEGLNLLLNQ